MPTIKFRTAVRTSDLITFIPGAFFIANLLRMTSFSTIPYFAALFAGAIGWIKCFELRRYRKAEMFFLIYFITLLLGWAVNGNVSVSDIGVSVLLTGLAFIMLFNKWTKRYGLFVFAVIVLILAYRIVTIRYRSSILTSSSNYISVVLLLAAFFYYAGIENERLPVKAPDLIPAVIVFAICVWAKGRGGILSALVLCAWIALAYYKTTAKGNAEKTVLIAVLLLLAVLYVVFMRIDLVDVFMGLGKFASRGVTSDSRLAFWKSYFDKATESPAYFLFGAPLDDIPAIHDAGNNCHNSFIQLHAYNGLVMFVLFFVMAAKAAIRYLKEKQYLLLGFLFTLTLRGMTDKYVFGQYGMPIFFYLVLIPLMNQKETGHEQGRTMIQ